MDSVGEEIRQVWREKGKKESDISVFQLTFMKKVNIYKK